MITRKVKRYATVIAATAVLATGLGVSAAQAVIVVGHRGDTSGGAVEGTYAAMDAAVAAGMPAVEFDVRITKDKRAVVAHDWTVDRVSAELGTGCVGPVNALTLAGAQACGLVAYSDMMRHLAPTTLTVFVHVKVGLDSTTAAGLVKGASKRTIFNVEDRANEPRLAKAGWVGSVYLMVHTFADWQAAYAPTGHFDGAVTYDADGHTPGWDAWVTPTRMAKMNAVKRPVYAVDGAPQSAARLIELGVAGVFTAA